MEQQLENFITIIFVLSAIAIIIDARARAALVRVLLGLVSRAERLRNAALLSGTAEPEDEPEEPDEPERHGVSDDVIDALARLVAAGSVRSAAEACRVALGIEQRGNNSVYRRVVARVEEVRAARDGSAARDEIVDVRPDGRVVRRDPEGRLYVVKNKSTEKEYIDA